MGLARAGGGGHSSSEATMMLVDRILIEFLQRYGHLACLKCCRRRCWWIGMLVIGGENSRSIKRLVKMGKSSCLRYLIHMWRYSETGSFHPPTSISK
eukprot:scaffold8682_cov136-Skeletonema_marinoi.AAC.1